MTDYPSVAPTPELAALFPTRLTDVEKLVYDYVISFATNTLETGTPALNDPRAGAPPIPIFRGWPPFPGPIPAIGISAGTEGEDQQNKTMVQFAGTPRAYDDQGVLLGVADYYAQPIYSPILVVFVHENRDERDRLHNELRRLLFPLTRQLPQMDGASLIKEVAIDAEKDEGQTGPDVGDEPMILYTSLFTVHVKHEMLEAADVTAAEDLLQRIDVTSTPADSGP